MKIISCNPESEEISLSNIDTSTDPKLIVDEQLEIEKPLDAVVSRIAEKDGYEYGFFVSIPDKNYKGFVYRTNATYSKYIRLSEKYPNGSKVKVKINSFKSEFAKFECSIADLYDPWEDIEKFKIGEIYHAKIREVTENYLTCEIEEGAEARIFVDEIAWEPLQIKREIIKEYRVGEGIKARLIYLDIEKKHVRLSPRQITESPSFNYAKKNNKKNIRAKISQIIEGFGVDITMENDQIYGFIPIGEIVWGFCENISDYLTEGEEIDTIILDYDGINDRIRCSIKRLIRNDFNKFCQQHKINDTILGKVLNIRKSKLFIQIEFNDSFSRIKSILSKLKAVLE